MEDLFKKKHTFLFQGVGADYKSMVHMLDKNQYNLLHYYCSIAHRELGLDLWGYLNNTSTNKSYSVFYEWAAIYTVDYIVYQTFTDYGIEPEMFMGYSMGLVTALACGKAISFETGLHILFSSFEYAQRVHRQEEAMAVITGITCSNVERIIEKNGFSGQVDIASENNEYCIVISGIRSKVEAVMSIAANEGAMKVKDINAPYAFHSRFAAIGIESYVEFLSKVKISDCIVPIISIYNKKTIKSSNDIRKELGINTMGRMYWKESMELIIHKGYDSFVEVSLADGITKFSKLINMDCDFLTYKKFLSLKTQVIKINANTNTTGDLAVEAELFVS
ncbi:MAG: ACP S-malonyltransferase [Clostridia bacterium]|nr:ACP S-malonyltransferase [Clostridia bacterium]